MDVREAERQAVRELERQVENLLQKGYPALAGLPEDELVARVLPLAGGLPGLPATGGSTVEPFALVVRRNLVPRHEAAGLVELDGRRGFTEMEPDDLESFVDLPELALPSGAVYLVTGVDTGRETLNVTPDDALQQITAAGRSPLTIDEGVAVVTQHPEVLEENCFSLLGSRCADRRVTAIWLSKRRPRLGWCWAGNPHTWLGSASCAARIGGVSGQE
jgi:hypothetical protein